MPVIFQTAEYAPRGVVHKRANHRSRDARAGRGYLSKVLQSLARAGLITSQRGLGGGFRLAKPPNAITIYEVVQAVDAGPRIRECPLHLALHARLDAAMTQVEQAFKDTTIADLVQNSNPLCKAD